MNDPFANFCLNQIRTGIAGICQVIEDKADYFEDLPFSISEARRGCRDLIANTEYLDQVIAQIEEPGAT